MATSPPDQTPARRRPRIRLLLGVLVASASVVFLWHFPWRRALGTLASASLPLLGLALFGKLLSVLARAERMHAMLHRELRVGRGALVRYVLCGFAADNLLASTAGVAARGLLLCKHGGARTSSVVGALALEKYVDGAFMGAGIWVVVHWRLLPVPFLEPAYLLAYGIGFAILVGALLCARLAPGTRAGRLLAPAGAALGSPSDAVRMVATTVLVWAGEATVLLLSMRALGLSLDLRQTLVLTTVGTLAFVIPGVPSGAGTFDASLVFGLRALGLEDGLALSAALLYHVVQVLPETLAGLLALRGLKLSLREVRAAAPTKSVVLQTS
ncbi:MAG TPA: lysylphosphatidylglycerol synthase transmembrane domain-containing protein [Polyangia bacterium]|nr:lysylphosphatidylglycerol synthase transmembrane domain-containing protein [Polyangia bacterium]